MKDYNRLNKSEIEFLSKYSDDFHEALKKVRLELEGPELDDPKYWELKNEISKIKKNIEKLTEFVDSKTGGY